MRRMERVVTRQRVAGAAMMRWFRRVDAEHRHRQTLPVRSAGSRGLLAGGVSPLAPAVSVEGLGGDAGRDRGHRAPAGGNPRPRERGARAEPLPAVRPDGGRPARGRGGHADLHDGELAPVHGQPVPGLAPEADRRVQRLPRGTRSHGGQGRDRAAGRGPPAARDLPGGDRHAGQRPARRVQRRARPSSPVPPRSSGRRPSRGRAPLLVPVALRYRFLGPARGERGSGPRPDRDPPDLEAPAASCR